MWVLLFVLLVCSGALSLWYHVVRYVPLALRAPHRDNVKVGIVLGSGGHTSEMLRAIRGLSPSDWTRALPFYVVSATDLHSRCLATQLEHEQFHRDVVVHTIPRAREVGQSYVTSILTTLKATLACLRVVLSEKPDVLLVNGPGVCVPLILAAVCVAAAVPWWYRRPAIVYMESFTCVSHLSLTGRLLAPWLADVFTVHWRALERNVAGRCRRGRVVYIGCEDMESTVVDPGNRLSGGPVCQEKTGEAYAVVTVGSTKYPALVEGMVQPDVCAALQEKFGITRLHVQYGTVAPVPPATCTPLPSPNPSDSSETTPREQRWSCGGLVVEAFPYRAQLDVMIRGAALVITHAGAGTILEGLQAQRSLVVVPNRQLMSDHQLELAESLAKGGFLFSVSASELSHRLPTLDMASLRPHPGLCVPRLREALRLVLTGFPAEEKEGKVA